MQGKTQSFPPTGPDFLLGAIFMPQAASAGLLLFPAGERPDGWKNPKGPELMLRALWAGRGFLRPCRAYFMSRRQKLSRAIQRKQAA